MISRSKRPAYAIALLVLSSLFMCATFLPLLYSAVLSNEDFQAIVVALEGNGDPPPGSVEAVHKAGAAVGSLLRAIKVGYYSGGTVRYALDGSRTPVKTKVAQATYLAWFEKRFTLVAITRYEGDGGQRAYWISEVNPMVLVRGYGIPLLLFGVSLVLVRRRKDSVS